MGRKVIRIVGILKFPTEMVTNNYLKNSVHHSFENLLYHKLFYKIIKKIFTFPKTGMNVIGNLLFKRCRYGKSTEFPPLHFRRQKETVINENN